MRTLLPGLCLALCACAEPVGAAQLGDDALIELFEDLHRPIYGIYELGIDRDAVHGALAGSFFGEQLSAEYVEHFTTLVRMGDEETSIRVLRVDYERIEVLDRADGVVRVDADWSVGGIVTHAGHKHPRVNRYRAVYELEDTPEGVRITGSHLRNLERVGSLLGGDGWILDDLPTSGGGFMDPLDYIDAGLGGAGAVPADPTELPADGSQPPQDSPAPPGDPTELP